MVSRSIRGSNAQRIRFLELLERKLRGYPSLELGFRALGVSKRQYIRWQVKDLVLRRATLNRYCKHLGLDVEYVVTGFPMETGGHLTLCYYQEKHHETQSPSERNLMFGRLVQETYQILAAAFPTATLSETFRPTPMARIDYGVAVGRLRFEVQIKPTQDSYVEFVSWMVKDGRKEPLVAAQCDENTLVSAIRQISEQQRVYQKETDDTLLAHIQKLEGPYLDKHNGRYDH